MQHKAHSHLIACIQVWDAIARGRLLEHNEPNTQETKTKSDKSDFLFDEFSHANKSLVSGLRRGKETLEDAQVKDEVEARKDDIDQGIDVESNFLHDVDLAALLSDPRRSAEPFGPPPHLAPAARPRWHRCGQANH